MRPLDITSKDAYLAWVAEWKAEYAQLSKDIRAAKDRKRIFRDRARECRRLGKPCEIEREAMWGGHWDAWRGGWRATQMIAARHEGKRLSWEAKTKACNPVVEDARLSA